MVTKSKKNIKNKGKKQNKLTRARNSIFLTRKRLAGLPTTISLYREMLGINENPDASDYERNRARRIQEFIDNGQITQELRNFLRGRQPIVVYLDDINGGKNKKRGGVRGKTAKRKAENSQQTEKKSIINSLPASIRPYLSRQLSYGSARNLRSTSNNGKRIVQWQDEYGNDVRVAFAETRDGWHIESTETGCIGCDLGDESDSMSYHCRACKEETRSRYY